MTATYDFLAVSLYAGLNGLILMWLGFNVGRVRQAERVSIGDGGNLALIRAMRGQANFVEYVPLCLILILLMAVIGTPAWIVHLFGLALTVGRLLHGWHFVQADAPGWQRMYGTLLTVGVLVFGSLGLIGHAIVKMASL